MTFRPSHIALVLFLALVSCASPQSADRVTIGIEVLLRDSVSLIQGKRVGVICNHTSLFPNGTHLADSLLRIPGVTLAAIFTPEHGFRGGASAGEHIVSGQWEGIPIYSLYGNTRRPEKKMLKGIDVLIFDLQDVGARFYTYISTMGYCMEEAAANNIPIVICDRPNPIRGDIVQGPVLDIANKSFVGMYPIPIRHGMTVAEIARMAAAEGWLSLNGLELHIIPMRGWRRSMWYDETGLPWIAPSPNIPDLTTALLYPGMCFMEGTNLSEGRGTEEPFTIAGAPFLDGGLLVRSLEARQVSGLRFEPVEFTPASKKGAASPKFEGQLCSGVRVLVVDRDSINPIFAGTALLAEAMAQRQDSVRFTHYLPLLTGKRFVPGDVDSPQKTDALNEAWGAQAGAFKQQRRKYLLYE